MTEVEAEIAAPGIGLPEGDQPEAEEGVWQRTLDNLRTGNLGVLPIVLGLVLIVVFFGFKATNFFTADNFNNIIIQTAGTAMLGVRGRLRPPARRDRPLDRLPERPRGGRRWRNSSCPGGHDAPFGIVAPISGLLAIPIAIGIVAAIGAGQGAIVAKVGVPSFVVTLAGLLIFQGVILHLLEVRGTILIQDHWINDTAYYYFSETWGWIIAAIVTGALRGDDRWFRS